MKPTDFAVYVTKFLGSYLPGRIGASTNTVNSYRDVITIFIKYCHDEKDIPPEKLTIKHCTSELITDFLLWLEETRGCTTSTRNQRLGVIRSFFSYLQVEEPEYMLQCQQILAIPYKKHRKPVISYLSIDALKMLFSMPDTTQANGRRDLTLLTIMYDTGGRVQEIADLTVGDVRLEAPATIQLTGKGSKSRIVPLVPQTCKILKDYMRERNLLSAEKSALPLFCNKWKNKLTRSGISYILEKYVSMAHQQEPLCVPENITPHCLRHSKAMHLLQGGVNLIYIRDLLGHVNIKTTEIYARVDTDMKRRALENAAKNSPSPELPIWHKDEGLLLWLRNLGK